MGVRGGGISPLPLPTSPTASPLLASLLPLPRSDPLSEEPEPASARRRWLSTATSPCRSWLSSSTRVIRSRCVTSATAAWYAAACAASSPRHRSGCVGINCRRRSAAGTRTAESAWLSPDVGSGSGQAITAATRSTDAAAAAKGAACIRIRRGPVAAIESHTAEGGSGRQFGCCAGCSLPVSPGISWLLPPPTLHERGPACVQ